VRKIGIVETGRPPEELVAKYGDYSTMIRRWLDLDLVEYSTIPVLDGALPGDPADAVSWIFTGSRFGVYEDHPWIPPLEAFIRECHDRSIPIIGICFGHQLIAQAMGGKVRKSDKGWGLGVHEYPVLRRLEEIGPLPSSFSIEAFHQDQVEVAPQSAHVVASSGFCPNALLYYPDFALTIQGHPEFSAEYAADLIELRRGTAFSSSTAEKGLEAVMDRTNSETLACIAREFITRKWTVDRG
jgi:GMP synthase-like glutamine amidotransferase